MADFTYTIKASPAGHPEYATISAALSDFVTNNRMGAGTGTVASASTLYFKIHGFIDQGGTGVTVLSPSFFLADSTSKVVIEADSNPFNATVRALGYTEAFDGFKFGSTAQFFYQSGIGGLTIRNLVIGGASANDADLVMIGLGSNPNKIENCILRNGAISGWPFKLGINDEIRNCVAYTTGTAAGHGGNFAGSVTSPKVEHCIFVALGADGTVGSALFVDNDPGPNAQNNVFMNWGTDFPAGTWSGTVAGNATSRASLAQGTGLANIAFSTVNFQNVTNGTEDFRVKTTSTLKTTGVARIASTMADIFGQSRSATTTPGPFAAEAGATGPSFTGRRKLLIGVG